MFLIVVHQYVKNKTCPQCTLVATTEADVLLTLQELFSVSGQLKKWGVRYDETRYPPDFILPFLM